MDEISNAATDEILRGWILRRSRRLDSQRNQHSAEHRDGDEYDSQEAVESAAARMTLLLFLSEIIGRHDRYLAAPA